jgi:hypothetical protein
MALLWSPRYSLLDFWLLVVLEAWMLNALLFNKLVTRWSVFRYRRRVFAALVQRAGGGKQIPRSDGPLLIMTKYRRL